jgi:drug/metabolite transporter (DMT)-like permease
VSFTRGGGHDLSNIGLAILAGLGFGVFFILLDQVQSDAVFWPLVAARTVTTITMAVILWLNRRSSLMPSRRGLLALVLLSSALDVGGNVFFLIATQAGRLDIAAVVSSLYTASTIMLARLFLKERLNQLQMAGVLAALAAIVLITI